MVSVRKVHDPRGTFTLASDFAKCDAAQCEHFEADDENGLKHGIRTSRVGGNGDWRSEPEMNIRPIPCTVGAFLHWLATPGPVWRDRGRIVLRDDHRDDAGDTMRTIATRPVEDLSFGTFDSVADLSPIPTSLPSTVAIGTRE